MNYSWFTRATYYKLDLDNDKLLTYVGWSETSKEHWIELVRWVKSGNVVCINDKVYFNEKKLRYNLEDTPKKTSPSTRKYNNVSVLKKQWIF
jgi:hypothetical protein